MDATVCTIVTQNVLEPVSPDDTSNPSLLPFFCYSDLYTCLINKMLVHNNNNKERF